MARIICNMKIQYKYIINTVQSLKDNLAFDALNDKSVNQPSALFVSIVVVQCILQIVFFI